MIVIDPRRAFASAERFPGVTLISDWPDEAFERLKLDATSAVVTLTHDPKIDDPALIAALGSRVFYVGALGGKVVSEADWQANVGRWLPTDEDRAFVLSLMGAAVVEPGKYAHWIAPPARGINNQPADFAYVRFN